MPQYSNFLLRDTLQDTGHPDTYDALWVSPDIVPWGPDEMPNSTATLTSTRGQDIGRQLNQGEINYLYLRGLNLSGSTQSTKLYLYWANPSLFCQPSTWTQIPTAAGGDYLPLIANGNQFVAGNAAFRWMTPTGSSTHYCLLAMASDSDNPLPGPFDSTNEFVEWVGDNPGVAWRNVNLSGTPPPPSWQGDLQFGNPNDYAAPFLFLVNPIGLNLTAQISMQCAEEGPNPPIDGNQASFQTTLPAGFQGVLDVRLSLPGNVPWPAGSRVCISYFQIGSGSSGQMLQKHAATPDRLQRMGIGRQQIERLQESAGFLIPVGSYTVRIS
ncbi:MAG TPA: hypothetical protein VGS07_33335 [Thermoanaerobaculia bacterium]|jgi:hypothetical protein|nr:hypothetical protein [Thermoanaerobaculia bacterium]